MSPKVLEGIALEITKEKNWKNVTYSQVVRHGYRTEFIYYKKHGIIFSPMVLWIDIDNLKKNAIVFLPMMKKSPRL